MDGDKMTPSKFQSDLDEIERFQKFFFFEDRNQEKLTQYGFKLDGYLLAIQRVRETILEHCNCQFLHKIPDEKDPTKFYYAHCLNVILSQLPDTNQSPQAFDDSLKSSSGAPVDKTEVQIGETPTPLNKEDNCVFVQQSVGDELSFGLKTPTTAIESVEKIRKLERDGKINLDKFEKYIPKDLTDDARAKDFLSCLGNGKSIFQIESQEVGE